MSILMAQMSHCATMQCVANPCECKTLHDRRRQGTNALVPLLAHLAIADVKHARQEARVSEDVDDESKDVEGDEADENDETDESNDDVEFTQKGPTSRENAHQQRARDGTGTQRPVGGAYTPYWRMCAAPHTDIQRPRLSQIAQQDWEMRIITTISSAYTLAPLGERKAPASVAGSSLEEPTNASGADCQSTWSAQRAQWDFVTGAASNTNPDDKLPCQMEGKSPVPASYTEYGAGIQSTQSAQRTQWDFATGGIRNPHPDYTPPYPVECKTLVSTAEFSWEKQTGADVQSVRLAQRAKWDFATGVVRNNKPDYKPRLPGLRTVLASVAGGSELFEEHRYTVPNASRATSTILHSVEGSRPYAPCRTLYGLEGEVAMMSGFVGQRRPGPVDVGIRLDMDGDMIMCDA